MSRTRNREGDNHVPGGGRGLDELEVGDRAEIVKVGAAGPIKKRLLEMGLVPGTEIEVERVAPLGDPIEIRLLGYHLSLRRSEASTIAVKKRTA